jgi:hypothetical protein
MKLSNLKLELFRLLSKNGFSFTDREIDAFADRLGGEGFTMDESGSFWSPSGESLVSAIYRGWGDSSPASAPTKPEEAAKHDPYHGYSKADWEAMRPELRYGAADTGPATPSWKKNVPVLTDSQCAQHAGLSVVDFRALPIERRLEVEAVLKGEMLAQKGAAQ